MNDNQVMERKDVPQAQRWNAESLFADLQAWDDAFAAFQAAVPSLQAFAGTLDTRENVEAYLERLQEVGAELSRLRAYVVMSISVDSHDDEAEKRYGLLAGAGAHFASAIAFAEPEMLANNAIAAWAQEAGEYQHYFERLANKAKHLRSAEVEELLGALRDPFGTTNMIHSLIANRDMVFPAAEDSQGNQHDITQSNIGDVLASPDRTLRKNAYQHYAQAHLALQHGMAANLAAGVKQNVFRARARGHNSALEAALAPEQIPLEVFDSLINTFKANLPTWHKYWHVRKKALGVETLRPWDIFAPLSPEPPVVSFEQAMTWLGEAMQPLGQDYVDVMMRGALEQRWVDYAVNKGKRMGAFSMRARSSHPFIMMSYSEDVFGMSTLAHELGHSMHSYLSDENQPMIYGSYSLFLAEIASNFNQALLRRHLFDTLSDKGAQIALVEEAMGNFHRYFLIMPTLARFERTIHERIEAGQPLSAPYMNDLLADLFGETYGDAMVFDRAEEGITWAQFHTHLYSNFYVYQYATGISAANIFAERIYAGEAGVTEAYLGFLKSGSRGYALDVLDKAGLDLRSPEAVESTFAELANLVDRLDSLVS